MADKKAPAELRTTRSALKELSEELGISETDMGGKVTFEGKDPFVASKHHLGESMATLLALFGMELAAIWKQRTGKGQDVKVNVRNAMCNLAAIMYAKQNGVTPPYDDAGMVETTDFFRCKDGRWVFIVCSLPHLRQLACEVLDCQATKEEFVDRCMRWNGADLEEAMAAVGASCAMVRSREEWFASEQGQYTMRDPLISIEKIGDSAPVPFTPNPDMPLSGIRIIDNTHIYAGPICARYASDAGADVMHVVPPLLPNPPRMDAEVMPGKLACSRPVTGLIALIRLFPKELISLRRARTCRSSAMPGRSLLSCSCWRRVMSQPPSVRGHVARAASSNMSPRYA